VSVTIAVVPIFVNAGAAVLPAIVAGLASGVALLASGIALLFKPRELLRVFRRRPIVPVILLCLVGVIWFSVLWIFAATEAEAHRPAVVVPRPIDWREVGQRIVNQRRRGLVAAEWFAGLPGQLVSGGWPAAPAFIIAAAHATPQADIILGRDAGRCGYDGGVVPLNLHSEWSYRDTATFFLATPAVHGGKVFAGSWVITITTPIGYLIAIDATSGQEIWKKQGATPDGDDFHPFFSSPAITQDGKYLIVGQGTHEDTNCSLLCLETASGKVKWQVPTPLHLESSPAIRGDLAVIGAGAIEDANHKPKGDPGFVLAVQISTGNVLWRHPVNDPESSPAIGDDGTVYIGAGFNGNAVVALRSETDAELKAKGLAREVWRTPAPYPVTSAVTLAGDLVLVGAGNCDFVNIDPRPAGLVMALDRKTGAIRWKQEMGDSVLGYVSCREGKVVCPVRNGDVALLDLATGNQIWRKSVAGGSPILAGCAFTGSHIYVVTKNGRLAVMSAADGAVLQSVLVNDPPKEGEKYYGYILSAPIVVGGNVYVGSETGGVRCFTGK
jgi:outer membrane protein assembly factor BamB